MRLSLDATGVWPSRIAIIGAGTMGIGLSHVFASAGLRTDLADTTATRAEDGRERSVQLMSKLEARECVDAGAALRVEQHLFAANSLDEAVAAADLIIEAVVERTDVKRGLYAAIEVAAAPSAVIATNASSIPIALLASGLQRPERFLGVHWFVPPLLVPGVEVIASPSTAERTVSDVVALLTRLGKVPVVVGDGPGFVANRIQFALFKEAATIVEEGIATPAQVDEVVRSSFGFRLPFFGPFTIADMAGLDVYADIFGVLERSLGEAFSAPAGLAAHVANGDFGTKTGRGFLEISAEQADELVDRRNRAYVALSRIRRELDA